MEFEKLSKEEKAVAVAKDILLQLNQKVYKPCRGSYISGLRSSIESGSIKDNFDKIETCQVCAIGSFLLSSTHLYNKLDFEDLSHMYITLDELSNIKIINLLSSIFDDKTLFLIEECFESDYHFEYGYNRFEQPDRYSVDIKNFDIANLTEYEIEQCQDFYEKHGNNSLLVLKAICNNIIDNNGQFIL